MTPEEQLKKERQTVLRRLRALAKSLGVDTEQMYNTMSDITLWGDDTHEDFGNLKTVSAQIRMILDETSGRRYTPAASAALVERVIRAAVDE